MTEPTVETVDTRSTTRHSAMAGIARSGAASLLGSGVSAIAQFAVVLVATQFYPPAQAGALFTATAAVLLVTALVQLGADQGMVRFVAWHRARGEHETVRRLVRLAAVPVGLTSLLGGVAVFVAADVVASWFADDVRGVVAQMLRALAVAVPLAALHEVFLAGTRGYGTMRPTILVERLLRPLLQPIAMLAVGLAGADAVWLAVAWVAPYGLAAVLSAVMLLRLAAAEPTSPPVTGAISESGAGGLRRQFWSFALARGAARAGQVALQRVDVILVAALVSTSAAAVYTAATRFIALGQLANQAVQQVIQPRLAALLSRGEHADAQHVVRQSTLWLTGLAWPGYLALVALAPVLLTIFGESYAAGASSVIVLALAMMAATAAGPVDVALLMAGRSWPSLASVLVALVVDVVGCLLLLPHLGVLGAALAWAAAIIARNLLAVVLAWRMLGISAWSRPLVTVAFAAIACVAVAPLGLAAVDAPVPVVITAVGVGVAGYSAVLWPRRRMLVRAG